MVAFLCLIALGWYAFASVPREEDPYFKIPGFTVAAIYPGADPKDLERLIAKPLEDRFATLDDVLKMETSIRRRRVVHRLLNFSPPPTRTRSTTRSRAN